MTPAQVHMFHQRRAHDIAQRRRFEILAFHEVGHAAAVRYLGLTVESLRVGFDGYGGQAGQCFADIDALRPFSRLMLFACGGAAERRFSGSHEAAWDGDDTARSLAIVSAEFRDLRAAAAEINLARRAAEHFIDQNWIAIAALTRALIDAGGRMTGKEVEPFLRGIPRAAPVIASKSSERAPAPTRSRPAELAPPRVRGTVVAIDVPGAGRRMYRSYVPADSKF